MAIVEADSCMACPLLWPRYISGLVEFGPVLENEMYCTIMYTCIVHVYVVRVAHDQALPPCPPTHSKSHVSIHVSTCIHVHPLHMHIVQNIQAIVPAPPPLSLTAHGWWDGCAYRPICSIITTVSVVPQPQEKS